MKTRSNQNPSCKTCGHMFASREKGEFLCMLKDSKTAPEESCKKYIYDIYKYEPKKKADFGKFKKEDFDIQGAIQIGQDFSVAQMIVQDINALRESMNTDTIARLEISNILDSIKVCPLCGKPMEECND